LIKVETELQNRITYTAVEEQWESNSALKVDKPVVMAIPYEKPLAQKRAVHNQSTRISFPKRYFFW
jgi:hypothetical protein